MGFQGLALTAWETKLELALGTGGPDFCLAWVSEAFPFQPCLRVSSICRC